MEDKMRISGYDAGYVCDYFGIAQMEDRTLDDAGYGIVREIKQCVENKRRSVHFPAMLLQPIWFAYRDMYGCSLASTSLFAILYMVLQRLISLFGMNADWKFIAVCFFGAWIINGIVAGILAIPMLSKKVFVFLNGCGLYGEAYTEDKELHALLSKKGKPSLLRVPFYLLTQFLFLACAEAVFVTVKYGLFL